MRNRTIVQFVSTPPPLAKGQRTKERILDAAEALFAKHGYDGVAMRMVADAAGLRLGLLSYHFASKELLFETVVGRRAADLNSARTSRLRALAAPTLEEVLDAFLSPFLERIEAGDSGWRAYARLIAHVAQDSRWLDLSSRYFGAVGQETIDRMRAAEPGLSIDGAIRGYVHLVSVMMGVFAATGLLDRFSSGRMASDNIKAHYWPMIQFAAAGIRTYSLAGPSAGPRPSAAAPV